MLSHVQGSWSPGCDCWSVVQSASAIVFTLTFAPVLHRVSALTPTPLLLSSLVDMLEAGLTPLCLVWSNSHCGVVTTLTLVSLVLWVFTMTSTPLQLLWLVDRHGVGLLSLCVGWLIPKRVVVDPWSTGFTVFSLMVIYLSHYYYEFNQPPLPENKHYIHIHT